MAYKTSRETRERYERIKHKWAKLKSKARPCVKCGCENVWLNATFSHKWSRFFLECEHCYFCGKSRPTIRWAMIVWNRWREI